MEEWAKDHRLNTNSCAGYHGTWQYLRLLDMVAVPHWHRDFYNRALDDFLRRKPHANILISAAADLWHAGISARGNATGRRTSYDRRV